jgi:hypothetical protein
VANELSMAMCCENFLLDLVDENELLKKQQTEYKAARQAKWAHKAFIVAA